MPALLSGQSQAGPNGVVANESYPFSITLVGHVKKGHTGYLVTCDEQPDEHDKYVTIEPGATTWGCQLQPFAPGEVCTPRIWPIDAKGNTLAPIVLGPHSPNGKWRKFIRGCDWFYDPADDTPMLRMDPLKLFISYWRLLPGTIDRSFTNPNTFVALNDQKHWHISQAGGPVNGSDHPAAGVSTITVRPQAAFATRNGQPLWVFLEIDSAADGRNLWYITITPNRLDDVGLTPDNGQFMPVPDALVLTIQGRSIQADLYDATGLRKNRLRIPLSEGLAPFIANWRGSVYRNVRQQLGVRVNQNSFTLFADVGYNGLMVNLGTVPLPFNLPWWGSNVYVLMSNGAYHVSKTADRPNGPSNRVGMANGQSYLTNPRILTHWGMIGIRAPAVKPFSSSPVPMADGFYEMPAMNSLMDLATPFVGYWSHGQVYQGKKGAGLVVGNRFVMESTGMALPIKRIWSEDGAEWVPPGPHLLDYIGAPIGKKGRMKASFRGKPNQIGFADRSST